MLVVCGKKRAVALRPMVDHEDINIFP